MGTTDIFPEAVRAIGFGREGPVFFYCVYVRDLPWEGEMGSTLLLLGLLILPTRSRQHEGNPLEVGLLKYLPTPLEAFSIDRCKNFVRASKTLWGERVHIQNGEKD